MTPHQCGRTFIHRPHQTTEGPCPGLRRDTVQSGRRQRAIADARDAAAQAALEASRG